MAFVAADHNPAPDRCNVSQLTAYQAGNEALMAYVEDEAVGPIDAGPLDENESEND